MVIISYEGKFDGEFFDSLLDTYKLVKNQVTYYDFEGSEIEYIDLRVKGKVFYR